LAAVAALDRAMDETFRRRIAEKAKKNTEPMDNVVWTAGDQPPSLLHEPLTVAERELLAHWTQFRPQTVASLRRDGTLEQTVRQTLWDAQVQELHALADGATVDEARERTRELLYAPERE
jgi:hypothetical protein